MAGTGVTVGAGVGTIIPGIGTGIGGAIGGIIDSIGSLFGGRSDAQIQQDEYNSAVSNQIGIQNKYGITLSLNQVATILKPGWDNNENGTQLFNRISNYVQNNINSLQSGSGGAGGVGIGGSNSNLFVIGGIALAAVVLLKVIK